MAEDLEGFEGVPPLHPTKEADEAVTNAAAPSKTFLLLFFKYITPHSN